MYDFSPIRVFRCPKCGLGYLNPCLDSKKMAQAYETTDSLLTLNDFYQGYHEYGGLDKKSKTMQEIDLTLSMIERHHRLSTRRLFEIGPGNGLFLAAARRRGWDVSGVESSPKNVQLAKEKFGLDLVCGLFEDRTWEEAAWDVVVTRDVLEHRHDPCEFLARIVRMVKPDGLVLVAVPNHDSLLRYLSMLLYWATGKRWSQGLRKVYLMEHSVYYVDRTLTELFVRSGLEPLGFFQRSTDLAKFSLTPVQKWEAGVVLFLGALMGLQNRLVMLGRRKS